MANVPYSAFEAAISQQQQQRLSQGAPTAPGAPTQDFGSYQLSLPAGLNTNPGPHEATNLWEDFVSGLETSTSGLIARQENPDLLMAEQPDRVARLLHTAGQVLGDLPTYAVGALAGGAVGGPFGAGAASFGLTEGIRSWLTQQYDQGETRRSVADRLTATAWAAAKGATIGAATAGTGALLAKGFEAGVGILGSEALSNPLVQAGIINAGELSSMVTVSNALEGHLPAPGDFLDAAIVLGGFKAAHVLSGRLKAIYERTGIKPDKVSQDALSDTELHVDVTNEQSQAVPPPYRGAEKGPMQLLTPEQYKKMFQQPFQEPSSKAKVRQERQINTEHWEQPDAFKEAVARLANVRKAEMRAAADPQTLNEISVRSRVLLEDMAGHDALPGGKNWREYQAKHPLDFAAEVDARRAILEYTTSEWTRTAQEIAAKKASGGEITADEIAHARVLMDRIAMAADVFNGRKAEAGRALRVLREARSLADSHEFLKSEFEKMIQEEGGIDAQIAAQEFAAHIKDPGDLVRAVATPTFWDKLNYIVKSFLVSGLRTHEVNLMSNLSFAAIRVPESQLASIIGYLRRTNPEEHVRMTEGLSVTYGMIYGAMKAVRAGNRTLQTDMAENGKLGGIIKALTDVRDTTKVETGSKYTGKIGPPIKGPIGKILGIPFKLLSVGDAFTGTMNVYATIYQLATRKAINAGFTPGSRGFFHFAEDIVRNVEKHPDILEAAEQARRLYNFQEKGGPWVKALMKLRHDIPVLNIMPLPFLQTPAAIFREFFRRTPAAPFVRQWREDWKAGGGRRDMAYAQMAMGTSLSLLAFLMARNGALTGGGHPDPNVRNAWRAAGWQPYAIRSGDTFYSISRYEPIATLFGMTADVAESWDLMRAGEQDKAWKSLTWAFSNVVANKTWLKSLSTLVNAIASPDEYAESWLESLTTMAVPQIVGQSAQMMDPYVREVNGITDAVRARIPGFRETLAVRRDIWGQPIEAYPGVFPTAPTSKSQVSQDPVRREAARLGVGQPSAPNSMSAGSLLGIPARLDLTAQQKDVFGKVAGETAYSIMNQVVHSPMWSQMHPLVQRQMFVKAFNIGRRRAAIMALPPQQRLQALQILRQEYNLQ